MHGTWDKEVPRFPTVHRDEEANGLGKIYRFSFSIISKGLLTDMEFTTNSRFALKRERPIRLVHPFRSCRYSAFPGTCIHLLPERQTPSV